MKTRRILNLEKEIFLNGIPSPQDTMRILLGTRILSKVDILEFIKRDRDLIREIISEQLPDHKVPVRALPRVISGEYKWSVDEDGNIRFMDILSVSENEDITFLRELSASDVEVIIKEFIGDIFFNPYPEDLERFRDIVIDYYLPSNYENALFYQEGKGLRGVNYDVVIVVGEYEGIRNPVFSSEEFRKLKVILPEKIRETKIRGYSSEDTKRAIELVESGEYDLIWVSAYNFKWNSDVVINRDLLPEKLPEKSGTIIREIV